MSFDVYFIVFVCKLYCSIYIGGQNWQKHPSRSVFIWKMQSRLTEVPASVSWDLTLPGYSPASVWACKNIKEGGPGSLHNRNSAVIIAGPTSQLTWTDPAYKSVLRIWSKTLWPFLKRLWPSTVVPFIKQCTLFVLNFAWL